MGFTGSDRRDQTTPDTALLHHPGLRGVLPHRCRRGADACQPAGRAGPLPGLAGRRSPDRRRRLLPDLRDHHCGLAARGHPADAARRCAVRARLGALAHLLRQQPGGDARRADRPHPGARAAGAAFRHPARAYQRRHRARGGLLSLHAAVDPALPLLRDQPGNGPDPHAAHDLLLGQSAGHAARHRGLRERRSGARPAGVAGRHPLAGPDRLLRDDRPLPLAGPGPGGHRQASPAGPSFRASGALRSGHRGDRRRLGGAGGELYRLGGQGAGGAGRARPAGRRLPQYRLRALQGPHPRRTPRKRDPRGAALRRHRWRARSGFHGGDGPCASGHPRGGAPRQPRALRGAGRRGDRRRRRPRGPLAGADPPGRDGAGDHHPPRDHRQRGAPAGAAAARPGDHRGAHLG